MDFIAGHKDYVSVEVTPHHLTLDAPGYARLGTRLQMNPPIRSAAHRRRLWQAVGEGVADVLGSDHAPHTLEEKARPYPASPSGMPGVQTLVPVMLDHVAAGRLSLARFVDLASARAGAAFRHRRQGPHRGRLRCRPDDRRPEATRDDPRRLDRLALRLDAL